MEKKEARLDYIFKCYKRGLPVTKEELKELYDNKYDVEYDEYEVRKVISDKPKRTLGRGVNGYNISLKRDYTVYGEEEIERHDISESEIVLADSVDYENDIPEIVYEDEIGGEELIYHGFNQISKKEWMPESVIYHTKEFYAWIDSVNKDFTKRIYYEPFSKYVQQSSDWMAMGYSILDHTGQDEIEFVVEEMERCSTNTLYFANKYGFLQEASEPSGRLKYLADENYVHHQILFFLIDCGYSFMLGKPRQIGSTSALGIAGICKTICKPNHYLKFITEDKDTGLEIFRDKIMFPFSQLPEFMKPEVLNDRENLFSINQSPRPKGKGKTTKRGAMSKVQIVAPTKTAINGGSPQMVFIDEIGSIPILSEMMNEGRPTMFIKSRVTGLLEQRRQLIAWGTGTTEKGGAAYEKEWTRIVTLWEQREPSVGIVPVFFDWHTRCDEKFYLEQKRYYYGGRAKSEAMDIETSRIQFHQHYPSSPSDMFIPTGKTLISRESIDSNLNRIRENMDKYGYEMQYGFFEPIFDRNKPTNSDSEFPFKITGAHFIQTDAFDDRVTTEIFIPPDASWKYRFYAGTDPISTDTGASRMATVVWDEQNHTIAAITDCKISNNPNYSFLQSMLLTIYYGTDGKAIPEIVERNISLSYRNYRENLGYLDSLVLNAEIDAYFQSGVPYDVGIDNRSKRTSHIISTLGTVVDTYGNRFYHSVVFRQLSTFHCSITRGGNETWSSIDKRYYNDDVLFGLVYAYICAMSVGRKPVNQEDGVERKISTKYKIKLDANYNLIRVPITQIEYGKRG